MDEKVLIKSERYDVKKFFKILMIVGIAVAVIFLFIGLDSTIDSVKWYTENYQEYLDHQKAGSCGWYYDPWDECYMCETISEHPSAIGYGFYCFFVEYLWIILIPIAAAALIGYIVYLWLHNYEMTVTDKRIFGTVGWSKRVDLPVDSVTAVASDKLWRGVAVSTASGRIRFIIMKNADAIYEVLNNLLIERQKAKQTAAAPTVVQQSDSADQLKKYKDLLDSGVITQEEFDAKKAQLLGL